MSQLHHCRYEAMGLDPCSSKPNLYPCSPCREAGVHKDAADACDARAAKPQRACTMPAFDGRFVLTGTPSSGPDWHREYLGAWTTTRTALEAEEQRQRSATTPCARCSKPVPNGGMHFCSALWRDDVDVERHDRHVEALRYALSSLPSAAEKASMMPVPVDMLPEFVRKQSEPKPPTLREWLGDRASELGRWAEVLRPLPEPAGHIEELLLNSSTGWLDYLARGEHGDERGSLTQHAVVAAINPQDPFYEALQMALFTRHPAVAPEPRPLRIGCEDQYELLP
jgi:hypothetical protein